MNVERVGDVLIDLLETLEKRDCPMPLEAAAEYLPSQDVEGGE